MNRKVVVIVVSMLLLMGGSMVGYAQKKDSTATLLLSAYQGRNPEKAATDYYLRGKETILLDRNMELGLKYFLKAIECDPNHGASNYELASFAAPNIGLAYSLKAYQSDTTNYWYCAQLADIFSNLRAFDKAIAVGEKMIKMNPDNIDTYKSLAANYFYENNIERAMALMDTIKTRFGENPEAALLHCNMIKNLKQPSQEQLAVVQEYAQLYNDIPQFVILLGDIYIRLGRNVEAVECYKRVKIIDPEELRGDVALFDFYNRRQNQAEAIKYLPSLFKFPEINVEAKIELYKEFIETNVYLYRNFFTYVDDAAMSLMLTYPNNMEVRALYSDHLLKKGDIDAALSFNKTGLENNIFDFNSYQMIMEIEAYNKNFDSMKVYLDKGLELFPEKARELNLAKMTYYTMTNQSPKAIELIEKEIKEVSGDSIKSVYYGILGDLYHSSNKNKPAYKAYEKALKHNPENIIVLNNYSYYLSLEEKNLDLALKMSLIVLNKEPSNSTYIDTYAWILYKLGRYNEAREIMAKAVALDTTKSSSLALHYGDILYKLGQRALAESYWNKALEYGEDQKVIEQRMNQK